MKRAPLVIGVDVGGTTTAAGGVAPDGEIVFARQVPTHAAGAGRAEATIADLIASVRADAERAGHTVTGIGIGVPAPVDASAGVVGEDVPHVPELAGRPLGRALGERFALPTFVDNDVNALALGEWMFGVAQGVHSLVLLAPGTGFGTGIVLEGRLVRGAHGYGAEFGHTPVKFDGPPCWCGGRGCLALYASGRGIAEAARTRVAGHVESPLLRAAGGDPLAITVPLVFRMAEEGDTIAAAVVGEACRALGAMVGTIVNGLNPEVVVITGGVTAALLPLEKRVLRAAGEYAFRRALAQTRVVFAPGDKATTMRGAGALVYYEATGRDGRCGSS